MKFAPHLGTAPTFVVCLASGCQMFPKHHVALKGHSPLRAAQSSPDSVAMNIVWARFPANEPVLDGAAWREIDETQIDPAVRRALVDNGLRAGIITGSLPTALDKIMR